MGSVAGVPIVMATKYHGHVLRVLPCWPKRQGSRLNDREATSRALHRPTAIVSEKDRLCVALHVVAPPVTCDMQGHCGRAGEARRNCGRVWSRGGAGVQEFTAAVQPTCQSAAERSAADRRRGGEVQTTRHSPRQQVLPKQFSLPIVEGEANSPQHRATPPERVRRPSQ